MRYILVFEQNIVRDGKITRHVGMFDTTRAAVEWHAANFPRLVATIDVLLEV